MTTPLLTGIDVGTTKVSVLIADLVDDTHYEILGVGTAPARGMQKGVLGRRRKPSVKQWQQQRDQQDTK